MLLSCLSIQTSSDTSDKPASFNFIYYLLFKLKRGLIMSGGFAASLHSHTSHFPIRYFSSEGLFCRRCSSGLSLNTLLHLMQHMPTKKYRSPWKQTIAFEQVEICRFTWPALAALHHFFSRLIECMNVYLFIFFKYFLAITTDCGTFLWRVEAYRLRFASCRYN